MILTSSTLSPFVVSCACRQCLYVPAGTLTVTLIEITDRRMRFHADRRFVAIVRGGSGLINAGVYLLQRQIVRHLPAGRASRWRARFFPPPSRPRGLWVGLHGALHRHWNTGRLQAGADAACLAARHRFPRLVRSRIPGGPWRYKLKNTRHRPNSFGASGCIIALHAVSAGTKSGLCRTTF